MRLAVVAAFVLAGLSGAAAGAQAPAPSAEVRKLEAWVGTWRYEGEAKETPIGPASKISGMQTGTMVMGGFALQWTGEEKGPLGAVNWGEMGVYDPAAKNYPYFGYQNDGTTWSGVNTVTGNNWKAAGQITSKGVTYRLRSDFSMTASGKSGAWKNEISSDGKTWMPFTQGTVTKVK